jgi:hypothetical protein
MIEVRNVKDLETTVPKQNEQKRVEVKDAAHEIRSSVSVGCYFESAGPRINSGRPTKSRTHRDGALWRGGGG